MNDELLTEALRLAAGGGMVLPLHSIGSRGCTCGRRSCPSPAKHPRLPNGLLGASSDRATIVAWWYRWPFANVGLRTGRVGRVGLLVLDVDGAVGEQSCKALQRAHGPLPATRWVRTGGGGWHAIFGHPDDHIGNSAGKLGPGLDVRADGGFVVAPPSLHASGEHYRWHNPGQPIGQCPGWLVDLLRPPLPAPRPPLRLVGGDEDRYSAAAVRAECEAVAAAVEGTRNHALNRAAYNLGQLVGAGRLAEDVARQALLGAALACGLGQQEAERTIASGLAGGIRSPRQVVAS